LRIKILLAVAFSVALMTAVPAFAHHSFAMFDNSKLITIKGKVVEYRWENPHTHIIVKVAPGAEDPAMVGTWDVEGASINIMARQGWTKLAYKAGDPITAVGHPLKSGDKGESLSYVILPDGTRMYQDVNRPGAQAADKPAS
jgi:hypothetical protein